MFKCVFMNMNMNVLDAVSYWTAVYEEEYQAEEETQDSLMSLAFDDLMTALGEE